MKKRARNACAVFSIWAIVALPNLLALDDNDPLPVTHRVTVQPTTVSNSDGSNSAELFGDASQQVVIEGLIESIRSGLKLALKCIGLNQTSGRTRLPT